MANIPQLNPPPQSSHSTVTGMGCSAGVIAIDLARQMLQLHPNSNALVVSTENITQVSPLPGVAGVVRHGVAGVDKPLPRSPLSATTRSLPTIR